MSVENLIGNDLNSIRAEEKKAELQISRSIVSIIAQAYINQGKERIVELSRNINRTEGTSISQKDFFTRLGPQDRASATLNQTAIFMGIYLQTIEEMLIYKTFNARQMIENYNSVTIGTPLERSELGDKEPVVKLSSEAHTKMIGKFKEDPSLGILLEQPEFLPKEFQELLANSDVLLAIKHLLLPSYKKQYQILAGERKSQTKN